MTREQRPVVLLFDIDGTLLLTGGASSRCIRRAAQAVLGVSVQAAPITVGTLDPQIFAQLAAHCGMVVTPPQAEQYQQLYLNELAAELAQVAGDVKALPGVVQLLHQMQQRRDVIVGLLTGNFREAALLKLRMAGLDQALFSVGAFAEHGNERSELVHAALQQARALHGSELAPAQTILIGDTPRDIACARKTGCRVAAVATGHYRVDQLQAESPDVAMVSLLNPRELWELIEHIQQQP